MPILPAINSGTKGAVVPLNYYAPNTAVGGVQFGGFPSNIQNIEYVIQIRNDSANNATNFYLNSDVGTSSYSITSLYGDGSSAISGRGSNLNYINFSGIVPPSTATTGIFSTHKYWFLNPNDTTNYKTILWRWSNDENGSGNSGLAVITWRKTAAISTISLTPGTGNFVAGSTFSIFGTRSVNQ